MVEFDVLHWGELARSFDRNHINRVVIVNAFILDHVFAPYSRYTGARPVEVTLMNTALGLPMLLGHLHIHVDCFVVKLDKATFTLAPDRAGNDRALKSVVEPLMWPFRDRAQLESVTKCAPLLSESSKEVLLNHLNKR